MVPYLQPSGQVMVSLKLWFQSDLHKNFDKNLVKYGLPLLFHLTLLTTVFFASPVTLRILLAVIYLFMEVVMTEFRTYSKTNVTV